MKTREECLETSRQTQVNRCDPGVIVCLVLVFCGCIDFSTSSFSDSNATTLSPYALTVETVQGDSALLQEPAGKFLREVRVSNSTELSRALSSARAGDLILLKGGVNYGDLVVPRFTDNLQGTITIRSLDLASRAMLNSLTLNGVEGFTLDNVIIANEKRYAAVVITNSKRIVISNGVITSNHDPHIALDKARDGVAIRSSEDVKVLHNTITRVGTGLYAIGVTNAQIEGNTLKEIIMII